VVAVWFVLDFLSFFVLPMKRTKYLEDSDNLSNALPTPYQPSRALS
jgi:hypothetical protein